MFLLLLLKNTQVQFFFENCLSLKQQVWGCIKFTRLIKVECSTWKTKKNDQRCYFFCSFMHHFAGIKQMMKFQNDWHNAAWHDHTIWSLVNKQLFERYELISYPFQNNSLGRKINSNELTQTVNTLNTRPRNQETYSLYQWPQKVLGFR